MAETFVKRLAVINHAANLLRFIIEIFISYIILAFKFIQCKPVDAIFVGHPGYFHVHLAWILKRIFMKNAKLVYDIFIPLYEATVTDRELIKPFSFFSNLLFLYEKSCCRIADLNLIDTNSHGTYLVNTFKIDPSKIARIFVGPTINVKPIKYQSKEKRTFKVVFVGTFIPLHGVDIILESARILQDRSDIKFTLVGRGQLRSNIEKLSTKWQLKNVNFLDWIPTEKLGSFILSHDLSLGIFGRTSKTKMVIPSKIFDICASGVPFITSDTPAIREVFIHGENAYLIPLSNAHALANSILKLKNDPVLREKLASGALDTGRRMFSIPQLGSDIISSVNSMIR
ncbi:putative Glycosyl transferase, group 1 [Desulfosarcina cetonica]|nr:putative Glycosyl transferase, group 1 [Desulfosarcina cetonica]